MDECRLRLDFFTSIRTNKIYISASSMEEFLDKCEPDRAHATFKRFVHNYQNHVAGIGIESHMKFEEIGEKP